MKPSEIIANYSDELTDKVVYSHASDIDTVAYVLGIDHNYLSSQVRLHIPWYSEEEIQEAEGVVVIRQVLAQLRNELSDFSVNHKVHRALNGIDTLAGSAQLIKKNGEMWIVDSSKKNPIVKFCNIPPAFGLEIQKSMHYIHHARFDTKYHFGLALNEYIAPLCYASFSDNDRQYLENALLNALPEGCSKPQKVAVMTRAFGYNPLPKNMMSTLFSCSAKELKNDGYDYIVTALNPYLGFKGSIFWGASYFPFATSPMAYIYDKYGKYLNRRNSISGNIIEQKYETPPILWLVHPLNRKDLNIWENAKDYVIYNVSQEEYARG